MSDTALDMALANLTGAGFGGVLGYATVEQLHAEAQSWCVAGEEWNFEVVRDALEVMAAAGDLLEFEGTYSGLPVQCEKCGDDPCSCGVGTWR